MFQVMILLSFITCITLLKTAAGSVQKCFTHEDCIEPGHFCAWAKCLEDDGRTFACGECKPCNECICDVNSTDFQCPLRQCPAQPINGVRFLQGSFYNHSILQIPGYQCIRQLIVMGSTFSLVQTPIYMLHPATKAKLDAAEFLTSACPAYARSGFLRAIRSLDLSSRAVHFDAFISSEGDSIVWWHTPYGTRF